MSAFFTFSFPPPLDAAPDVLFPELLFDAVRNPFRNQFGRNVVIHDMVYCESVRISIGR